jgi:transcriptional regulator with XRE-family HTH domain
VVCREDVLRLYAAGLTQGEIADKLGVTPPTISYHMRRLGFPPQPQRRQDWAAVQIYYDEGHSLRECRARFGFSNASWYNAVQRGAIIPRAAGMPVEKLTAGRRNRTHLKQRLVRLGLLEDACAECGITEWRGKPLALCLHHINGVNDDNRLENLAVLCPNCHSQTENFAGRNRRGQVTRAGGVSGVSLEAA